MPTVIEEELGSILIPLPDTTTSERISQKISSTITEITRLQGESESTLKNAKEKTEKMFLG